MWDVWSVCDVCVMISDGVDACVCLQCGAAWCSCKDTTTTVRHAMGLGPRIFDDRARLIHKRNPESIAMPNPAKDDFDL